jgi:hypothetical protein
VKFTQAPTLRDAANVQYAMNQTTAVDGSSTYQSGPIARPGIYTLSTGLATYPIAVNVDPREADTRLVDPSVIRKSLGGIDVDFEGDSLPQQTAGLDAGNDFGWPLMAMVLALIGAESFMAMHFGRRRNR